MDNTTKALLIAAAVLIAIILISVGILLIRNVGSTVEQADQVGDSISLATGNASSKVTGGAKRIIISEKKFNSFIDNFYDKYSDSESFVKTIVEQQNEILKEQIKVIGYVYVDDLRKLESDETDDLKKLLDTVDMENQQNNKEYFEYVIEEWMPYLLENGKIVPMENALSDKELFEKLEKVWEKNPNTNKKEFSEKMIKDNKLIRRSWSFGLDQHQYIDRAYYIAGVLFY